MLAACWRRKLRQLGPKRRGAGCRPVARSKRRTVLGETRKPELPQLARDPRVTPTRVLTREPKHQLSHPAIDRRPAGLTSRLRPLPPHELPVPPQECLRVTPSPRRRPCGSTTSKCGEEGTIRRPQRRAASLPAKHDKLMPQHDQLVKDPEFSGGDALPRVRWSRFS
jgi:hypothetical protein